MKTVICDCCGKPAAKGEYQFESYYPWADPDAKRETAKLRTYIDIRRVISAYPGDTDRLPKPDLCNDCFASILESVARSIKESRKPETFS